MGVILLVLTPYMFLKSYTWGQTKQATQAELNFLLGECGLANFDNIRE